MINIVFAATLMVFGIAHAQNQTDSFARVVEDKKTWQEMNWDRFEASKVWTANGWNDDPSKEKKRTFVKSRTVRLFDIDFKATLSRSNNVVKNPWTLAAHTGEASTGDCDKAMSWATTRFGSPAVTLDGSHDGQLSNEGPITVTRVSRTTQWDVGQTRILVWCDGITPKEKQPDESVRPPFLLVVSFHHKSETEVKPMFMLSCSRKITQSDGKTGDATPLLFYVDEYYQTVRNPQKRPYSGDHNEFSITPETITFAIRFSETLLMKYSVNRLTGSLYGTGTTAGTSHTFTTTGMCEKVEPTSKKF
jgi:hypothetical protein